MSLDFGKPKCWNFLFSILHNKIKLDLWQKFLICQLCTGQRRQFVDYKGVSILRYFPVLFEFPWSNFSPALNFAKYFFNYTTEPRFLKSTRDCLRMHKSRGGNGSPGRRCFHLNLSFFNETLNYGTEYRGERFSNGTLQIMLQR